MTNRARKTPGNTSGIPSSFGGTPSSKESEKSTVSQKDLSGYFQSLNSLIAAERYHEANSLCDKILELNPNDADCVKCKIYCLIQLELWASALKLIAAAQRNTYEDFPPGSLVFEHAFCLYKKNRLSDAKSLLHTHTQFAKKSDDRVRHLYAQILFRLGEYEDCQSAYESLLLENPENEYLLSNEVCAAVSGDVCAKRLPPQVDLIDIRQISVYELAFNLGTYYMRMGNYSEAESLLLLAEELCKEEVSAADSSNRTSVNEHPEVIGIRVQLACLHQLLGGMNEAVARVYSDVLTDERERGEGDAEATVLAVAQNNLSKLRASSSLNTQTDRIDLSSSLLRHRFTTRQAKVIVFNSCLSLLKKGKLDECAMRLSSAFHKYGKSYKFMLLAAAVQLYRDKYSKSFKFFKEIMEISPNDKACVLGQLQLAVRTGKWEVAFALMKENLLSSNLLDENFIDVYIRVKEKLVAEQSSADKNDSFLEVLFQTMICVAREKDHTHKLVAVLKTLASGCIRSGNWALAVKIYQKILDDREEEDEDEDEDEETLCGLIFASALAPQSAAYSGRLIDMLQSAIDAKAGEYRESTDVEDLLEADWTALVAERKRLISGILEETIPTAQVNKPILKVRKRVRKVRRYPKDYDPEKSWNVMLDPERWVAKRDRASYKKMLRRKDPARAAAASQGAYPANEASNQKAGQNQVHSARSNKRGKNTRTKRNR